MRSLIQVSPPSGPSAGRGAAQASSTRAKAVLQVTVKRPRRKVRASEREQWKPFNGRMPRSLGSTQKISGSSCASAMGKMPLR